MCMFMRVYTYALAGKYNRQFGDDIVCFCVCPSVFNPPFRMTYDESGLVALEHLIIATEFGKNLPSNIGGCMQV
jgi:hypothetical protein